jgi:hypothetical protein
MRKPRDGDWLAREALEMYSHETARALQMMREDTINGAATPARNPFTQVHAQMILGGKEFTEKVMGLIKSPNPSSTNQMPSVRIMLKWSNEQAAAALNNIAVFYNVPEEQLFNMNKRNNWPRDAAITIFRRFSRWPSVEIGRAFRITGGAISKAEHRVDQLRRDNNNFDREFQNLCAQFEV